SIFRRLIIDTFQKKKQLKQPIMLKNTLLIVMILLAFTACKNESKEKKETKTENNVSAAFNKILDNYYQEGLKLNQLSATFSDDTRYKDSFPIFLSDEYTSELKKYYTHYKEEASKFDDADLSETEKMSKDILLWECNIN